MGRQGPPGGHRRGRPCRLVQAPAGPSLPPSASVNTGPAWAGRKGQGPEMRGALTPPVLGQGNADPVLGQGPCPVIVQPSQACCPPSGQRDPWPLFIGLSTPDRAPTPPPVLGLSLMAHGPPIWPQTRHCMSRGARKCCEPPLCVEEARGPRQPGRTLATQGSEGLCPALSFTKPAAPVGQEAGNPDASLRTRPQTRPTRLPAWTPRPVSHKPLPWTPRATENAGGARPHPPSCGPGPAPPSTLSPSLSCPPGPPPSVNIHPGPACHRLHWIP